MINNKIWDNKSESPHRKSPEPPSVILLVWELAITRCGKENTISARGNSTTNQVSGNIKITQNLLLLVTYSAHHSSRFVSFVSLFLLKFYCYSSCICELLSANSETKTTSDKKQQQNCDVNKNYGCLNQSDYTKIE